jgi:MoxR-like ATPase
MTNSPELTALNERINQESEFIERLSTEVGKVIVGQKYMIERLLIGLLSSGHIPPTYCPPTSLAR